MTTGNKDTYNLLLHSEMTQNSFLGTETTKRYDIPLNHFDYRYIRSCKDVKELEKILKVLRSGDEGSYPDLEKETEERIQTLNPKSRVLRKDAPILTRRDLESSELETLDHDLETWRSTMAAKEESFAASSDAKTAKQEDLVEDDLPPVRTGSVINADGKKQDSAKQENSQAANSSKRVQPRSYQEWDKFDIDKELEKVEKEPEKKELEPVRKTFKAENVMHNIDTKGMTEEEKKVKAVREKDKGNEAFHSHDYEECILYYTRSISIAPLAATYNNRALAYLRLSRWDEAVRDCNYVLKLEPQNIKALLRRGTGLKGKGDMSRAAQDMKAVLEMEPNNKTALDLVKEINAEETKKAEEMKARKEKGRRMVIEEVDGSEDEEEDNDVDEEIEVEKPDSKQNNAPLVNGHAGDTLTTEEASSQGPSVSQIQGAGTDTGKSGTDQSQTGSRGASANFGTNDTDDSLLEKTARASEKESDDRPVTAAEKPQLVTTNILHETTLPPPFPSSGEQDRDVDKSQPASESEALTSVTVPTSAGAGDADSLKQSKSDDDLQQKEKSGDEEDEETESDMEGGDDTPQEDTAPVHARPVFVQKAFPAKVADEREKGNGLFRSGQYAEAITVYSNVISKLRTETDQEVNLSLMYSNRAACFLKTGDCQSTIADCTASLDLLPHSAKPLLRRASAYETMERFNHAYIDYKHVLSLDSSAHLAHQGASRCQHILQERYGRGWREKLPPLTRVSQWDIPEIVSESDPKRTAGNAPAPASHQPGAKPSGQTEKASAGKADVEKERAPADEQKRETATRTDAKPEMAGNAEKKEEQFEQIKSRGNKHVQKGEYEEATRCYCQCLEIFTDRAAVYTNRALCYIKLNKAEEAEADCSKALSLEPENTKAFYRRALARKMNGHHKDSLQDLLQLLRLEPSNTAAKREMELVKTLYKKEFDQLKHQPAEKKSAAQPEKKRTRMKIEEVEDESDAEEQNKETAEPVPPNTKSQGASATEKSKPVSQAKSPKAPQKPQHTAATTSHASGASDKPAAVKPSESRKPGRGKSKKGGVKETSVGLPVAPPTTPSKPQGKITPYEFIQHWNGLKQAKNIQPYVHLLEQVAPDDLPSVISNKLDGHMLQIITRCAAHDAQTGEMERAYKILSKLRQVPRFSTVVMFLSSKEKQDIRKVLESVTSLGTYSAEDVAAVKKDYGVK